MIHIVTASNRQHYRAQLAEMHQLRRVHFVEERGWSDLKVVDGGEYDAYDDDRTVYVLALGPQAQVLASMRARPTDDKCMLTDVFPDLIGPDQPRVSGPGVWEISRIFSTRAARAMRKANGGAITMDILLATMEWTQDGGVDRLVGVIDLPFFAPARGAGWNVRMTGLPLDTDDGPIIGIEVANTTADIDAFRRINGRTGRAGYMVTDADIAVFGGLAKIEAEFALVSADGRMMPGEAVKVFGARNPGLRPGLCRAPCLVLMRGNDMNRFGEIADELTELIEELEGSDLADRAGPLAAALERAYVQACLAERRLRLEAPPLPHRHTVECVDDRRHTVVIALSDRRKIVDSERASGHAAPSGRGMPVLASPRPG